MRPRNWCSCASPKRSACSIAMTVASGTSTPTSITVVETRSRVSPAANFAHRLVFFRAAHLAMHEIGERAEALAQSLEAILRGGEIAHFGFFDQRADPVDPLSIVKRAADRFDNFRKPVERNGASIDRLAAGRLLAQFRNVHVAEIGQHQACAGSASRSSPACRPPRPCSPARAADARRSDAARRSTASARSWNTTSSWNSAWVPTRISISPDASRARRFVAFLAALAAGEDFGADAGGLGQWRDGLEMLARENFGRRHQRCLHAGLDHGRGGKQRHHGLAGADIALQQPHHAFGLAEIGDDGIECPRCCDSVSE